MQQASTCLEAFCHLETAGADLREEGTRIRELRNSRGKTIFRKAQNLTWANHFCRHQALKGQDI